MKEENIDRLFRENFLEAEEAPSQDVWQRIERELDTTKAKITRLPLKKNWVKYTVAATLMLATTFTLFFLKYKTTSQSVDRNEKTLAQNRNNNRLLTESLDSLTTMQKTTKIARKTNNRIAQVSKPQRLKAQESYERINLELKANDLTEMRLKTLTLKPFKKEIITTLPARQITEVEEIQPLILLNEEEKSMYAQTSQEDINKNIVTSILNTISEKIEITNSKEIRFRADEEGSIRIDILNSLARNRNKKK